MKKTECTVHFWIRTAAQGVSMANTKFVHQRTYPISSIRIFYCTDPPLLNSLNNYTVNLKCIYLQNYKALTCKNIYMPYKINTTLEYFGSFTILYPPPPILNNPCNQTLFYNLSSANHKALQRTTASLSILISLHRKYLSDEKYFSVFIDNISQKKNISLSSPTISLKWKIFLCLQIFRCLNRHYFSSKNKTILCFHHKWSQSKLLLLFL